MSDKSKIEWTDATWNCIRGCVKVSAGCKNCYAETFAERWRGVKGHPYEQGFDLRLVPEKLLEPLKWKKPRRVFVNSMSDLFQDGVPDSYIDKVFAVMALTLQNTYQILTKRPERMRQYLSQHRKPFDNGVINECRRILESRAEIDIRAISWDLPAWPLKNCWLGVSVENQATADERIPRLLQTPAAVRFVSYEPALGPIDFQNHPMFWSGPAKIDWLICGGESGPGARPMDVEWVRSVVRQCKAAGVACFVKQLGSNPYEETGIDDIRYIRLKSRKGGDMNEWSPDLRVREFPKEDHGSRSD